MALTNVTPAGSVSVTTTAAAALGPAVGDRDGVGEVRAPAFTVAGPVLVVTTSACSTTVVVTRAAGSEPLLLAGTGSAVLDVLAAMLSSVPVAGAVTVTL